MSSQIYEKIARISNRINVPGKSYSKFDSEVIVEDGNKPIFCGVNLADRAGSRQTRLDEYLITDNETDDDCVKLYKDTFNAVYIIHNYCGITILMNT